MVSRMVERLQKSNNLSPQRTSCKTITSANKYFVCLLICSLLTLVLRKELERRLKKRDIGLNGQISSKTSRVPPGIYH